MLQGTQVKWEGELAEKVHINPQVVVLLIDMAGS